MESLGEVEGEACFPPEGNVAVTQLDRILQELRGLRAPDCPPLGTLGDFLDARIGSARRTLVQAHLERCPACTNRLLDLRELARLEQEGEAPQLTCLSN